MLQIIGWLGCLYLFVKGLEITSNAALKNADGMLVPPAFIAVGLSIVGSLGFAIALLLQGAAFSEPAAETADYLQPSALTACLGRATTDEEMNACVQ